MSECLGVKDKACGKWVYDPQFPNDNVCDQCAKELDKEEANA